MFCFIVIIKFVCVKWIVGNVEMSSVVEVEFIIVYVYGCWNIRVVWF